MDPSSEELLQTDNGNQLDPAEVRLRDLPEPERLLQTRYWGITNDHDLARCAICSKLGHMPNSCKARDCIHCGKLNAHFPVDCPLQQKCSKCRERGHDVSTCQSKLACSAADGLDCDLCHGNHREESCSWLWRTFIPSNISADRLTKVLRLPAYCYQCGAAGHWGDDCYAYSASKASASTNDVFSANFANQFLASVPEPREFKIRGTTAIQNRPPLPAKPSNSWTPINKPTTKVAPKTTLSPAEILNRRPQHYRAVPPPTSLNSKNT